MTSLLIYPQRPETVWSFQHTLKSIAKNTLHQPLGLPAVAENPQVSLEKKLTGEIAEPLPDHGLEWADYAFISGMGIQGMRRNQHPFALFTKASIDPSHCDLLMRLMARAGSEGAFLDMATPCEGSLAKGGKSQNENRDLAAYVKKIQSFGLEVRGGFIVGSDNDASSVLDRQPELSHSSPIATAMVGLLNTPRVTRLYERIAVEGPVKSAVTGDNTDFCTNGKPKMGLEALARVSARVIESACLPKHYCERVRPHLRENLSRKNRMPRSFSRWLNMHSGLIGPLFNLMTLLVINSRTRFQSWKLPFWSFLKRPQLYTLAVIFAIYGFQFRKVLLARP